MAVPTDPDTLMLYDAVRILAQHVPDLRRKAVVLGAGAAMIEFGISIPDTGTATVATQSTARAVVGRGRWPNRPAKTATLSPGQAVPKKRIRRTRDQMAADHARQNGSTQPEQTQPAAE